MLNLKSVKSRTKQFSDRKKYDPIAEQVRKVLTGTDQRLILMVRG